MAGYGSLVLIGILTVLGAGLLLAVALWRGRSTAPTADPLVVAASQEVDQPESRFLGPLLLASPVAFLVLWGLVPVLTWRTVTVGVALGLVILVFGLSLGRSPHSNP